MECPTCGSPDPARHPTLQPDGGEVQLCPDGFHHAALRDDTTLWAAREGLRNQLGRARDAGAVALDVPVDALAAVLNALDVVLLAGPGPRRG